MWFVRPQLFFHCTLRPIGARVGTYNRCDEDIPLDLVFFSPFEELRIQTAGILESKGIHRVYEPSPVPTLYVGRVEVPLRGSFHAFWTEMQPPLFHTSTAAGRGTLLSAAVPMVRALTRGGAAMFTRSTPGCGTLDGPSLAWAASLWPKLRRSEGSPGLRLPNADGQPRRLAREFRMVYTTDIPVYTINIPVYTWYVLSSSEK